MARNYAALLHEYLDEMDILSDAEFGRLCRALLRYSMDGKEGQLEGAEKVLWKRVKNQEDRFQESYKDLTASKRLAGKKGAARRWHKIAEDCTSMADDGTAIADDDTAIADDDKHGNTETKTETETNTLPSNDGKGVSAPAHKTSAAAIGPDWGRVSGFLLDNIDQRPSPRCLGDLQGYMRDFGPDLCIRVMEEAMDSGQSTRTWNYIDKIFKRLYAEGIRTVEDFERRRKDGRSGPAGGDTDTGTRLSGITYL